jgi:putative DNA primase/helicase
VFGNHKQNTGSINWQAQREGPVLSAEERARMRQQWREEELRRARALQDLQLATRNEACRLWQASPPAAPDHPYAARKRMRVGGLRQDGAALLVPMRDTSGRIWNLQRIYPDGAKRFMPGGRIIGLSARIGLRPGFRRGVFAEGYATGEAISQALGDRPVIVAFNTGNLDVVVGEWVRLCPLADWVIAADDDHLTGTKMVERGQPYQNPGIDKALAVAAAHGCRVAFPPRPEGAPQNVDFSDLLLAGRAEDIVTAINGARRRIDPTSGSLSLAERIGQMGAAA